MQPDDLHDDQDLKPAFAELHRRECAPAPSFGQMRQRAMSEAGDGTSSARSVTGFLWLAGAPAAVLMAVAVLWWTGREPAPPPAKIVRVNSTQRVEQLLTSIEQQFEFNDAISSAVFPTDALLTRTDIDLSP